MKLMLWSLFSLVGLFHSTLAYPGMKNKALGVDDPASFIGPSCTLGAHNWHPEINESCPSTAIETPVLHYWPSQFTTQWTFYYIDDYDYAPPYDPLPTRNFTFSTGQTYYDVNYEGGSMIEVYNQRCIPIWYTGPLAPNNNFSCDFINIGSTQTSYLVLHEDKPVGAPDCCIVGQPFHSPPPDFIRNFTNISYQTIDGVNVDWFSVVLDDAGLFSYGFVNNSLTPPLSWSTPYAFYMVGLSMDSSSNINPIWMYQVFERFQDTTPDNSRWSIPSVCKYALPCPGFEPDGSVK